MTDVPDFVKEIDEIFGSAEPAAKEPQQEAQNAPEVTIKFGKGLVGEPFTSKNGKELVEIQIPNADPNDKRPWESFVTSPKMIHENKFGNGLWMKLPENGTTRLMRSVKSGIDADGKTIWRKETREVANTQLKAMVEVYKTKESVLGKLSEMKGTVAASPKKDAQAQIKKNDISL